MKLVIALGGNALLRRGQPLSAANQLANIRVACRQLANVANQHELVITHGNGPQVGLLALQSAAYSADTAYPLDVLGAQTEGMIGYLLEQELSNLLPPERTVATLLTRTEVSGLDPAFQKPTKPIGPVYTAKQAKAATEDKGWVMVAEGPPIEGQTPHTFRRVVPSPQPLKVLGLQAIRWLLAQHAVVIAAGGGGIPVVPNDKGTDMHGVEAVIDKDLCAGLLARELEADVLVIATDVPGVLMDWGLPTQRAIERIDQKALSAMHFEAGSMGPKVRAACDFVSATSRRAVIGSLSQIEGLLAGTSGTQICLPQTTKLPAKVALRGSPKRT